MEDPTNFVKPEELYKHRSQRALHGFSTYDWWNFNWYLSWVIIEGLEKFKNGSGYPGGLRGIEEWNGILDKMIDGFKARMEMDDWVAKKPPGIPWKEWAEPLEKKWEEGSKLFIEYYGSLWD